MRASTVSLSTLAVICAVAVMGQCASASWIASPFFLMDTGVALRPKPVDGIIHLDVAGFTWDEVQLAVQDQLLTVTGKHNCNGERLCIQRKLNRRYLLSPLTDYSAIKATRSVDGVLEIVVPTLAEDTITNIAITPYQPQSTDASTASPDAAAAAEASDSATIDVAGFQPSELSVSLRGRTLTITGLHDCAGRSLCRTRTLRQSFTIPPTAVASDVTCDLSADGVLRIRVTRRSMPTITITRAETNAGATGTAESAPAQHAGIDAAVSSVSSSSSSSPVMGGAENEAVEVVVDQAPDVETA